MVLIKNMEMPQNCCECKLADNFCLITRMTYLKNPNKVRQDDCPLLDVFKDEEGCLHPVE